MEWILPGSFKSLVFTTERRLQKGFNFAMSSNQFNLKCREFEVSRVWSVEQQFIIYQLAWTKHKFKSDRETGERLKLLLSYTPKARKHEKSCSQKDMESRRDKFEKLIFYCELFYVYILQFQHKTFSVAKNWIYLFFLSVFDHIVSL